MPGETALELRIIEKTFHPPGAKPRAVLRDITFALAPGEAAALFGPSGAGKTTLLRIAAGLDTGFAGSARRGKGRLGMLFQEPRLLPWLSIEANLRLVWQPGMPSFDAEAALAAVDLSGIATLRPGAISLGMARRVALARALIVDPALLILDEPFASLDPAQAARAAAVIGERASSRGTAILFTTHELDHAVAHAGRLIVLGGTPATIAADIALAALGQAGRAEAREALRREFPFLCTGAWPA